MKIERWKSLSVAQVTVDTYPTNLMRINMPDGGHWLESLIGDPDYGFRLITDMNVVDELEKLWSVIDERNSRAPA